MYRAGEPAGVVQKPGYKVAPSNRSDMNDITFVMRRENIRSHPSAEYTLWRKERAKELTNFSIIFIRSISDASSL